MARPDASIAHNPNNLGTNMHHAHWGPKTLSQADLLTNGRCSQSLWQGALSTPTIFCSDPTCSFEYARPGTTSMDVRHIVAIQRSKDVEVSHMLT
jgi:hypothetical protein